MLHDRSRRTVDAVPLILEALRKENCRRLERHQPILEVVSLDSLLLSPAESKALQRRVDGVRLEAVSALRRSCEVVAHARQGTGT